MRRWYHALAGTRWQTALPWERRAPARQLERLELPGWIPAVPGGRPLLRAVLAIAFALMLAGAVAAAEGEPPRQLFAHYMGCFPAGRGATAHHRREQAALRHDAADMATALGGRTRNWPLVPDGADLSPQASAELEIRRALRAGVDGFAMDAWAGDNGAKATLDALFAAAEAARLPFQLTICIDCSCLPANRDVPGDNTAAVAEAVAWLIQRHGNSPNLARRQGRPLIFGYSSYAIRQDAAMKALPEGPEKWQKTVDAYREVERRAGTPLFIHYCLAHYGHHAKPQQPAPFADYVAFMARNFGAVGVFLDSEIPRDQRAGVAAAVTAAGAEWSQPLWYQYENMLGSLEAGDGTAGLRARWEQAIATRSALIQFVTWNDYGENTNLAPGYQTNYALTALNAHYAAWWKSGREPVPQRDWAMVSFRRYPAGATTFPFRSRRSAAGEIEVVALLTAPASLRLPGRGAERPLAAGLVVERFPLVPGPVAVELVRDGVVALRLESPEPVAAEPFREDNGIYAISSDHDAQWAADFGFTPPLRIGEYGDCDRDGLPDWFEMYWQKRWLDQGARTQLDPASDPWGAGRTLRESCRQRKDPTRPDPVYAPGFTWDLGAIPARKASFNPDHDQQGMPVWSYLYRHAAFAEDGRAGAFLPCPHAAPSTPYTGPFAHLSPSQDPQWKQIHGWTCWNRTGADGPWHFEMRPRREALIALGWTSPVAGRVRLALRAGAAGDALRLSLRDPAGAIAAERVLRPGEDEAALEAALDCTPGARLLVIADAAGGTGGGHARISSLSLELLAPTPRTTP
ncbi:MAG: hypothetical protein L6R48_18850 [Planctomycetes bacterium]|nr:hypothetical protein [Planctomycetota bacterium]